MHNFQYVPQSVTKPVRLELEKLIKDVQDYVSDYFTFRFDIVGSAKRNMITCDVDSNIGFDFDYNIEVNDPDENYTPEEIKRHLMQGFQQCMRKYGYTKCENSTRVITIKKVDYSLSRIEHSCDFAIVFNFVKDGVKRQQYIRFNKPDNSYSWELQPDGFDLEDKIEEIKRQKLWDEVRDMYLELKCADEIGKKSRSLFAEAINNIYNQI